MASTRSAFTPYTTADLVEELVRQTCGGQAPTTYRALHLALGGDSNDTRHRHLDVELGHVQLLCAANGLPCLPALASSEIGRRPGPGFFTAYEGHYGIAARTEAGKDRIVSLERVAAALAPSSSWDVLRRAAAGADADPAADIDE